MTILMATAASSSGRPQGSASPRRIKPRRCPTSPAALVSRTHRMNSAFASMVSRSSSGACRMHRGLRRASRAIVQFGEVRVRFEQVGLERRACSHRLDRLFGPAQVEQGGADVVMGLGGVGLSAAARSIGLQRLRLEALIAQRVAETHLRVDVVTLDGNCLPRTARRLRPRARALRVPARDCSGIAGAACRARWLGRSGRPRLRAARADGR